MDYKEPLEAHEGLEEADSSDLQIQSGWGHILDEVKDSLPGIDSDSESSTLSEEGNSAVFNRKVATFDNTDSDSDVSSLGNFLKSSSEKQDVSAINSEGYASASSSSPTLNTSSATPQMISSDSTANVSRMSPTSNAQYTTLLFKRLQKHLKENSHQIAKDRDDLHLTATGLELPIYEVDKAILYEGLTDDVRTLNDESPPPLDMRPAPKQPGLNSETSSGIVSTEDADNFELELSELTGKAPVLSLRGLEGFDLEELLDDVDADDSVILDAERIPMDSKDTPEQSGVMDLLVGLSKAQKSSILEDSGRVKNPKDARDHFLASGHYKDEPGGGKRDEMKLDADIAVKKKSSISTNPVTSSHGVSTSHSTDTQLSLSEPTTIFLDLRPNKVVDSASAEDRCADKIKLREPFKQTRSAGVSAVCNEQVSERVRGLTRMRTMARTESDSESSDEDDDDEDYREWQAVRRRIKERSVLTADASPKTRNAKRNGPTMVYQSERPALKLDLALSEDSEAELPRKPPKALSTADAFLKKSFGENMPDIVHIDQKSDDSDSEPSPQEVDEGLEILDLKVDEKTSGIYARQRLKKDQSEKPTGAVTKSSLKDESQLVDAVRKGKVTVTFAEEPKKSDADTTNVYRAKTLSSSVTEIKKPASASSSVQTEGFLSAKSPNLTLHEVVGGMLTHREEEKEREKWSTDKQKSTTSKKDLDQPKSLLCERTCDEDEVPRETRLKLKLLLEREESKLENGAQLLYDMDASYEVDIWNVPPSLNTDKAQMVLLTINMSSTGSIVTHRTSGGHKATPVDPSIGFSITYPMLLSWLLALVPEDLNKLYQARMDDTFSIDIDPELVPELANGRDGPTIPISVDVPFNVVALHQSWQEDTQSLALQTVVIPNFYYKPESKRGRKKAKKEDAFLQVVWHFLQSNRINDVCPWHDKPESPIHYSLSEIIVTCATKPLSTYVAASNDPVAIRKALKNKPGVFTKMLIPDDQPSSLSSQSQSEKLQMTTCLLQKEAFMFPAAVMDIAIRLQTSCFDLAGIRLCYASRKFINVNTLYNSAKDKLDPLEVVPCVVMAIRGRSVISKWSKIVGPRDPILARMSERLSLNATYGEQLSIKRGDDMMPTDVNMFCYPRSESRALQQICMWFGGRVDPQSKPFSDLLNPISDGIVTTNKQDKERNGNGKGNGKNGKNKARSNSTASLQEDRPSKEPSAIKDLLRVPSYIVTCCDTRLFLVVSPRLPTQFISDVLYTVTHQGFQLHGVRRFRLNERKAAALSISSRYYPCFCPRLDSDAPVEVDYYEDIWWIRPATVLLLSRENAVAHQAGLIHALQTDLMANLSPPEEEGHMKVITYQCFHTTPYTEATEHAIGSLTKVPEVELGTGTSPRSFYSNPEMEQVVVLSLIGEQAIAASGELLRNLLHGDFPLSGDERNFDRYTSQLSEDDSDLEHFRGFELLGMKWLSSLSGMQANELSPFEVGTAAWLESIPILQSSPVMLFVLRRVNAFKVLEHAMSLPRSSYLHEDAALDKEKFFHVMSTTPQIAYRQIKTFFSDKELFPDNQSRPLLKYLPPPTRVHQYRQLQNTKPLAMDNDLSAAGGDQQNSPNGSNPRQSENSKRSSAKKKKKQAKKDNNNNHNGNGTTNGSFSLPDESIFSSVVACQHPLTSVIIIKPDAFPRHFIKIFRQLHYEGFTIVAMNAAKVSEHEASQILPSFLKDMQGESQVYTDHMTSGLSLVACVQRDNAVRRLCELAGPYDPRVARSKCYLQHEAGSISSTSRATWRALYGIDDMSNGIHVSDSYLSACEEMKLFFPEGLCCQETLELKMELVPTPAEDSYMCIDRMVGREVTILPDERQGNHTMSLRVTSMPRKPVTVVLTPPLFKQKSSRKSCHSWNPLMQTSIGMMSASIPPYLEILDQLITQGFEICAMRMVWFRQMQAEQTLKLFNSSQQSLLSAMTEGPNLLLVMQRENALVLFDSILGSTKSNVDSLYHKYSKHILRSQNEEQTKQTAKFLFPRIPFPNSVISISHKLMEWKGANGDEKENGEHQLYT